MGCEIVDELEHTRLDIFPVDSIWYREDDDGSLLHRRNRFTTEVLSEVRQIIIVPDDHEPGIINPRLLKLTLDPQKITPTFFVTAFAQESVMNQVHGMSYGGTMDILSLKVLRNLRIPLPPLATQQAIMAEIKAEQALVAANRELITRFEKKIQATLGRVWGEEEPGAPKASSIEEVAELSN